MNQMMTATMTMIPIDLDQSHVYCKAAFHEPNASSPVIGTISSMSDK